VPSRILSPSCLRTLLRKRIRSGHRQNLGSLSRYERRRRLLSLPSSPSSPPSAVGKAVFFARIISRALQRSPFWPARVLLSPPLPPMTNTQSPLMDAFCGQPPLIFLRWDSPFSSLSPVWWPWPPSLKRDSVLVAVWGSLFLYPSADSLFRPDRTPLPACPPTFPFLPHLRRDGPLSSLPCDFPPFFSPN